MVTIKSTNSRLNTPQKGLVSGVALSLLIAIGVLSAVLPTHAQTVNEPPLSADTTTPADSAMPSVSTLAAPTATAVADVSAIPAGPAHTDAYVGLGDSVAAGLGLQTWTTATPQDKTCGRSPYSYVFEVGRQLERPHAPYACTKATTANLLSRSRPGVINPNNQMDQAFAQGVPAIMSVTIGANDIGWSDIVRSCYAGNCKNSNVSGNLKVMQTNLLTMMQQILDRSSNDPPRVILTGYYNPVSDQCAAVTNGKLSKYETDWLTSGVVALNATLEGVADTYGSFVSFASVDFSGHDICSPTPWIQGLTDPAPLHPNATGQNVMAASVVEVARPLSL